MAGVYQPLLVPDCVDRSPCDGSHRGRDIRPAKGTEGLLLFEPSIGVSWVRADSERVHCQISSKVRLIKLILMGEGAEGPTVMHMAPLRVRHIPRCRRRCRDAALDILPFSEVRQIIDTGRESLHFLIDLLGTEIGRVDAKL